MQPYYQIGYMLTAKLIWGISIRKDEQKKQPG